MAFNLRENGVKWHEPKLGLTLWLNPDNSFWKLSRVLTKLDLLVPHDQAAAEKGDHVANNYRNAFMIAEAFVMDFECENTDSQIAQYLLNRSLFDIESNLEGFSMCLSYEQAMIFHQAYLDTRPTKDDEEKPDTEEEKKSSDSTS